MKSPQLLIIILIQSMLISSGYVNNTNILDFTNIGSNDKLIEDKAFPYSVKDLNDHSILIEVNDTIYRLDTANIELINEESYYNCYINNIYKMKGGYLINIHININDSVFFNGDIVSFNKNRFFKDCKTRIREGHTYRLNIKRYFTYPLHQSLEYKRIYDVLTYDGSVSILSIPSLSYLFVSQNLNGLCYSDSTQLSIRIGCQQKERENVHSFLTSAINTIYFSNDIVLASNIFDTTIFVKGSEHLSNRISYWVDPSDPIMMYPPRNIRKLNHFWIVRRHVKTRNQCLSFHCLMESIKNKYPQGSPESKNAGCNILHISYLQYSENAYTLRVEWELPGSEIKYSAIFILKPHNTTYKVIGFAWGIIMI